MPGGILDQLGQMQAAGLMEPQRQPLQIDPAAQWFHPGPGGILGGMLKHPVPSSKVQDLVFHGAPADFPNFTGKFFSDRPAVASHFAEEGGKFYGEGAAPNIRAAFLNIQNPFEIDAKGDFAGNFQFGPKSDGFRSALNNPKYDGIILRNTKDEGNVYLAKDPSQILSPYGQQP